MASIIYKTKNTLKWLELKKKKSHQFKMMGINIEKKEKYLYIFFRNDIINSKI